MSSLVSKLLAAQALDVAGAARVTAAVIAAGAAPGADATTLDAAIDGVYQRIADEKAPRREPPVEEHLADFVDAIADPDRGIRDAEVRVATPGVHRPGYVLTDDPPTDLAEPAPESEPSPMQRLREWLDRTLADKHKKIRLIAAGAAVVVTIAVLAVVSLSGGRGKPPEPLGITELPPAQIDNAEPARTEGPLIPSTVSANCGNDSDAVGPFSSEKTRAWVCKRVNGLDLNVLNITFDKPMVITSITIVPGFNYVAPDGRDEWARHRLVTGVTWRMGDAVYPQEITPTRTGVTKQFPSVITQEMSMTVTGSTRPPMEDRSGDTPKTGEHTAVSSITITGHPVDPGAGPTGGQP